jgi:hypothetical protein
MTTTTTMTTLVAQQRVCRLSLPRLSDAPIDCGGRTRTTRIATTSGGGSGGVGSTDKTELCGNPWGRKGVHGPR